MLAALNFDGCRAVEGAERAQCQLDKALVNVGALMAQEVSGRVCTEVEPRFAHSTGELFFCSPCTSSAMF
jgi:transaldolase